jgi:hypothetical protein
MALHFTKKPFILKLAPLLTGVSATVIIAGGHHGLLHLAVGTRRGKG